MTCLINYCNGGLNIREIYFDTETTGLDCHNCKIIELAMLVVEDDEIVEEYDEFIKIDEALPSEIIEITGITDDMLQNADCCENDVACHLRDNLSEGTLMIAHNTQFDLSFVYNLLKRHFPDEAYDIVSDVNWLDTLTVLKDRKNYPHKLIDAVEHYNVEKVNFHRAIDDTKALYEVTQKIKDERDDLEEYENIFGYNPKYGVSGERFSFIEYKPQYYHNRGLLPDNSILPYK